MKGQKLLQQLPPWLRSVARHIISAGWQCWLVGGALRDMFANRLPQEYDLATNAPPQRMLTLFRGSIPSGLPFGTVTIRHAEHSVEVTTFRNEGYYSDRRHPDRVHFGNNIEEDLARRDFTINALALNMQNGELRDPFGGRQDIQRGLLQAIGKATERFTEDPLRMLRALRFATTLGYRIALTTWNAIKGDATALSMVAMERLRVELVKIVVSHRIVPGFVLLKNATLLRYLMPELQGAVGYPQRKSDARTLYGHLVIVASRLPNSIELRLAGLLHDVAKPLCEKINSRGIVGYYGHEQRSAEIASDVLRRLRFSNVTIRRVSHLVRHHMDYIQHNWSDAALRRMIARVGEEAVDDILRLQYADCNSRSYFLEAHKRVEKIISQPHSLRITDLAINGNDLKAIGIPQGVLIGTLLSQLHSTVLDDPSQNQRETLIKIAKRLYQSRLRFDNGGRA